MGATFKAIWESWLEVSLAEPAGDEIEERRHAVYAGAIALMGIFLEQLENPDGCTIDGIRYIKSIRQELEEHTLSLL